MEPDFMTFSCISVTDWRTQVFQLLLSNQQLWTLNIKHCYCSCPRQHQYHVLSPVPVGRVLSAPMFPPLCPSLVVTMWQTAASGGLVSHLSCPTAPPPQTAAWETTGHQAGACLYALEQGSRPNQYLCISCPFAQVSSLIITAWRSFNVHAGRAKGRLCDLFPPRGGLGSHIQTLGQTKEANTHNITPGSFLCGNTLTACQSQTLNCSCL